MTNLWNDITDVFYQCLIKDNRYKLLLEGLKNTLEITSVALIIGLCIGILVAIVKVAAAGNKALKPLEFICNIYVTVIRGTPIVLQLFILYLVILKGVRNPMLAAFIGFGLNSGAYVSEIIRSGINSIDGGQMEAGRSLGLPYSTTMTSIILPQAVKNILPALGNEFISLLKETSIAGYIAIFDITKAGNSIFNQNYKPFILFFVGFIYLAIVMIISKLLKILERKLHKNDRN